MTDVKAVRIELILKTVLLLGLAGYFAYTIASGNLNYYINLRFGWLSYVAVFILAALGMNSLWALWDVPGYVAARERGGHADRQPTGAMMMMVGLPLLVGAATILTGSAKPLGVEAVQSINLTTNFGGTVSVANKDPMTRDIMDWSRLFAREPSASVFNGQSARVLGFVYTEPSFPEGRFMVARFTLSCCVADSQALGLPAAFDEIDTLKPGDWIYAEGTFEAEEFMGQSVPVLQVTSVELTEQPDQPYLYP